MHDTFLLKRISENLLELCNANKITKVSKIKILVSPDSHIHRDSLYQELKEQHAGLIGEWTEIIVAIQEQDRLTAVIDRLEGDAAE